MNHLPRRSSPVRRTATRTATATAALVAIGPLAVVTAFAADDGSPVKDAAHAVAEKSKEVGHAVASGAKETGKAVADGAKKTKDAVTAKSKDD